MKHCVRYTCSALVIAGTLVASFALAKDKSASQKLDPKMEEMMKKHTSMFTSEGEAENGDKVITLEGKMDCPLTGQKDMPMKQVFRIISRDKHVFEMHDPSKGDNSKTMEITYTRK